MPIDAAPSPWWMPHMHQDRRGRLLARGRITAALRSFFETLDFIEVETAILQVSPGNETHLHAFKTSIIGTDANPTPLYLHTSPEFAMKKLLAAGEKRIFTLARVFRNRERGALHAPEFTMLEWYRAHEDYEALMKDCASILRVAAEAAGATELRWRGASADPFAEPERLSVSKAFERHAGIDLMATCRGGEPNRMALAAEAARIGIRIADDDTWSDIFSRILSERIEPKLGIGRATILHDYPISEAALARPSPANPEVAERFELYACGVELANAFGELTDAAEQRRRPPIWTRRAAERYPLDEDFLSALEHMPPASGCALGLDRLVMLLTGASKIDDVQWTPVAE